MKIWRQAKLVSTSSTVSSPRRNQPGLTAPMAVYWLVMSRSSSSCSARGRRRAGAGRSRDRALARAQQEDEERRADDQKRQGDDADERHRHEVGELGQPPVEGSRRCRRQRQPAGAELARDAADELAPNALGLAGRGQCPRGTRAARARCSALSSRIWRTVRPTQLTKLAADGWSCARIQASRSVPSAKPSQCPKMRARPGRDALCQIGEHLVGRAVAIADQDEAGRKALRLDAVHTQVDLQGVVEQHEAREVQTLEVRERHHAVLRVGHSGLGVHRVQERAQGRLLAGATGATTMKWSCGVMLRT